jgi:hypothetical protein
LTPEQDFVFREKIEEMIKSKEIVIDGDPQIDFVRGISLKKSGRIFINLGAMQWHLTTEDVLVLLLTETIIHEHIHLLLKDYTDIGNSYVEEDICKLMSGQNKQIFNTRAS